MKTQRYLLLLSIICLSFLLVKCGKDGAIGPRGNAGDKGAAGTQGLVGPTGPAGTANVIYSDWINPIAYTKETVFDTYHFYSDIAAPQITQAILDNGTVIIYGKLNGYNTLIWPAGNVAALPIILSYKFSAAGITYTDTWSAITSVGKVRIDFVNDQNYYSSIATTHSFRYVIIPGGVHTTAIAYLNLNNYAEVKQTFHLTD